MGSAALSSGALCTALRLTPSCASAFRIQSKEAYFQELKLKVLSTAHIQTPNICWVGKWFRAQKSAHCVQKVLQWVQF